MRSPGHTRTILLGICGSLLLSSSVRGVQVTEIFFDGTDEYIELSTSQDEVCSGIVYLSGAKSSPVPLSCDLGPGTSVVFADKDVLFAPGIDVLSGYGRNFGDTVGIDRQLLDGSGTVLEHISISTGTIQAANNHKSSLTLSGSQRLMTTVSGSIGMIDGYRGSPTYRGDHLTQSLSGSGAVATGTYHPDCSDQSVWRITEVFLGSEAMSPFVELQAQTTLADPQLSISGEISLGSEQVLTGQRYPEDYLLITRGSTGLVSDDIAIQIDDTHQLGTGFLSISGQSGQVLDSVFVSHVISGSQNFVGQGCGRVFDSLGLSTPGYPTSIISYMTPVLEDPSPQPSVCPALSADRPALTLDGLWPAPPTGTSEAIALTLWYPTIVDLDRYYILKNNGSKRYLYGPEITTGSIILTGNFALPNSNDTCVTLWSDHDILVDSMCYTAPTAEDGIWIGTGTNPRGDDGMGGSMGTGEESVAVFSGSVSIQGLVYDPPGSDTGAEQVTITNHSNQTFGSEALWILIGESKTKRYWREVSTPGSTVTATASFALPNSTSTCVELHHAGGLLDTSCYTISTTHEDTTTVHTPSGGEAADIQITNLIHDPPGTDTDNESITLLLGEDQSAVDLSEYRLLVGTTRKKLQGRLQSGIPLTITKTRGFVNTRPSCATLLYDEKPIDYRCRSPEDTAAVDSGSTHSGEMMSGGGVSSLQIVDIIYDPPGNDTGREQIALSYTGTEMLDLSQAHLLINGRKKLLSGLIAPHEHTRLTDNFRLSNSTPTCVQLWAYDQLRDEYCYDPALQQESHSSDMDDHVLSGSIRTIYPNPPGADADREYVIVEPGAPTDAQHRSLQINGRTTRTAPTRDPHDQRLMRRGALSLPNRVGCVVVSYHDQPVDTFCYLSTDDDQPITTDQPQRHDLSPDALRLLNRLTITRTGKGADRLDCLRDQGIDLVCKPAPSVRTTTSTTERFYKDYIGSIHQYMYRSWPQIYYQTDLAQHRELYHIVRDALHSGDASVPIRGQLVKSQTSFDDLRVLYQHESYYDVFQEYIVRPLANPAQTP